MSVRPDPVIPETRRRRASTTEKSERILKMSRSLTLTRSVLAGTLAEATPNQLDFIERGPSARLVLITWQCAAKFLQYSLLL